MKFRKKQKLIFYSNNDVNEFAIKIDGEEEFKAVSNNSAKYTEVIDDIKIGPEVVLGPVFDYLTFFILLFILHSTVDAFRTTWFMESVISASFVVLVIRSQNIFFKSRPSKYLLASTAITGIITVIIPFTPFGQFFGLAVVSPPYYLAIGTIVILYIITAEIVKRIFYRWVKF